MILNDLGRKTTRTHELTVQPMEFSDFMNFEIQLFYENQFYDYHKPLLEFNIVNFIDAI